MLLKRIDEKVCVTCRNWEGERKVVEKLYGRPSTMVFTVLNTGLCHRDPVGPVVRPVRKNCTHWSQWESAAVIA